MAGTLFPGVLWAQAEADGAVKITKEMIDNAAAIADVHIADEYKQAMLENLSDHAKSYEEIYRLHIPNSVDPAKVFDGVDVIVAPTGGSQQLLITNLDGHPAVISPNGLRGNDAPKYPFEDPSDFQNAGDPGTPTSLTFLGKLYGEAELLAFARAYQEATRFHLLHPKLMP